MVFLYVFRNLEVSGEEQNVLERCHRFGKRLKLADEDPDIARLAQLKVHPHTPNLAP